MKLVKKLEKSLGKFAISRLYLYIVAAVIIGYVLYYMFPSVYCWLTFNPYKVVIKHQYWRCFTWFFTIPYSLDNDWNRIFLPLNLFFYYWIGQGLEGAFGKFSFNFYVFGGWFLSTIGMLGVSFTMMYISPNGALYREIFRYLGDASPEVERLAGIPATHYMFICIYFAFALIYGELTVLFMFVIPLKVKYAAWFTGAFLIYDFLQGDAYSRTIIVMCVMNFFIYYFMFRSRYARTIKDIKRQIRYKQGKGTSTYKPKKEQSDEQESKVYKLPTKGKAIHKCAICGRTELDDASLEFRYCSKCGGEYEYCSDHLYTHEHIINGNNENKVNN